jgi:hypothetical protein
MTIKQKGMALKHEKIYLTNTEKDMVRRVVK